MYNATTQYKAVPRWYSFTFSMLGQADPKDEMLLKFTIEPNIVSCSSLKKALSAREEEG